MRCCALLLLLLALVGEVRAQEDRIVEFSARDSLVLRFAAPEDSTGDVGQLWGEAAATAGAARLDAYRIDLLLDEDELYAQGLLADTGWVGRPRFEEGEQGAFTGETMAYNTRTRRGRVVAAETPLQTEEGFVRGRVVKAMEDSTLYVADGLYTTCDCAPDETPSYSLRSDKMKVQGDRVYTGPFRLYLFNIPTPLWLPFGYLPNTEGRRSGPLPPSYGEDNELGFYLRDWGYYWAINPYSDFQVTASVYTSGSFGINPAFRYRRRDAYRGQASLDYVRNRRGERLDPDFAVQRTARFRWNHNQEFTPYTTFGADVNLTSRTYLRVNAQDYEDRVTQQIGSSMDLRRRWSGTGRSVSAKVSQQQTLSTGDTDLTLPQLRFSQSSRQPFARERRAPGEDERWYEKITYSYSFSTQNRYRYRPDTVEDLIEEQLEQARAELPPGEELSEADSTNAVNRGRRLAETPWYEALFDRERYQEVTGDDQVLDLTAQHSIPIDATFQVNQLPLLNRRVFLTLTPSFDYEETWFAYTDRQVLEDGDLVARSEPGFYALRTFNTGVSASSRFYGLFPIRVGPFEGLRHTVSPNLRFSYAPDFTGRPFNYVRRVENAEGEIIRYAAVAGVPDRTQALLGFGVNNTFQTKLARRDTTGARRISRLNLADVALNTSYNIAADSFRLGSIGLSARTNILDRYRVNFNTSFSPYDVDDLRTRQIDRLVWADGLALPRLTSLRLTVDTEFSADRDGPARPAVTPRSRFDTGYNNPLGPDDPFLPNNTDVGYADFSIPWRFDVKLSYSLQRGLRETTRQLLLNTGFDFSLTPRWKITGQSGYDFEEREFVPTQLTILRDFDCWEMRIGWIPFGTYQSYSFALYVKSGRLRDILRLEQPRSDIRGRLTGGLEGALDS